MGVLYDLVKFCNENITDDNQSVELDDWLKEYPQYNTEPVKEDINDSPKSLTLDSE
jgi:hypothetical protein